MCALTDAPCLYIKYWPEDGSLEPKHVANYVVMTTYEYVLRLTNILHNTKKWLLSKP
jgi:hypothetical protein